jgi:hypothetical protein
MELFACRPSNAQNLKVATIFLDSLFTPDTDRVSLNVVISILNTLQFANSEVLAEV